FGFNYSLAGLVTGRKPKISLDSPSSHIIDSQACLVNLQQQKYAIALASCQAAVKYDANNFESHLNLGLAHYHLGNYQQAIKQDQLVIQDNPRDYRAFYNWGLANSARGEYQQAIEQYHLALSFIAENSIEQALIFNDLGTAWVMLKDYQKAIANLDRAIELDPSSLGSYFNRGCAHHRSSNYQRGIDDFTQVIALDSSYTEAYLSRAILYHLIRQEKAAYGDLDVALQQYREQGDLAARQKVIDLKNSMVASKIHQTA
ncbi:MAG: tetratricopeptide repeat protein, partial [Cyanobacteria bacterium J06600_6]